MNIGEPRTSQRNETTLPVRLENGSTMRIKVSETGGMQDINGESKLLPFKQVTDTLEGIIAAVSETINKAQPNKASVKFGIEIATEAGQLTAILVKGSGKANLEIELEWQKADQD